MAPGGHCAIVRTMRDGSLRVSEASALRWADLEPAEDGSGRLTLQRSKTDQEEDGVTLYLSRQAMTALHAIRQDAAADALVFGLSASQLTRRIRAVAEVAGLEG